MAAVRRPHEWSGTFLASLAPDGHRPRPRFHACGGAPFSLHVFYCGAMAAAITASIRGSRGAEWALVAQLGLGMLKGVNRTAIARAELPDHEAWFKRHAWVHALWVPLATWVWLWSCWLRHFPEPLHGGDDGMVCHAPPDCARKICLPLAFREYNLKTKENHLWRSRMTAQKETKKPKKNKK